MTEYEVTQQTEAGAGASRRPEEDAARRQRIDSPVGWPLQDGRQSPG